MYWTILDALEWAPVNDFIIAAVTLFGKSIFLDYRIVWESFEPFFTPLHKLHIYYLLQYRWPSLHVVFLSAISHTFDCILQFTIIPYNDKCKFVKHKVFFLDGTQLSQLIGETLIHSFGLGFVTDRFAKLTLNSKHSLSPESGFKPSW